MTSPTLRPVPAYAPIVVCVLCGAREIGRDGLWMESGCAYCDACVTRRRREMDAMFGKKRVPSAEPEAVRERVRRHREKKRRERAGEA